MNVILDVYLIPINFIGILFKKYEKLNKSQTVSIRKYL